MAVGRELAARSDVLAVLIGGSVGRGEHMASSDVDVVVVVDERSSLAPTRRRLQDGLLVEWIARTEAEWLVRFDRPKASWLYAFLEGEVVRDTGPAARLIEEAHRVLGRYRSSPALRSEHATLLWHAQAKLDRALASADPALAGFSAAVATPAVIDALYVAGDVPLPSGWRRLHHLDGLGLCEVESQLLDQMLTGTPRGRLQAVHQLCARLRPRLGAADHETDE